MSWFTKDGVAWDYKENGDDTTRQAAQDDRGAQGEPGSAAQGDASSGAAAEDTGARARACPGVVGYRTFNVEVDVPLLMGYAFAEYKYKPGVNTSECGCNRPDESVLVRRRCECYASILHQPHWCDCYCHQPPPVPRPAAFDHNCGFWAYHTPEPAANHGGPVVGAVRGWGQMTEHELGWRSEHLEIVALAASGNLFGLKNVAKHYGVPLVLLDDLAEVATEHGGSIEYVPPAFDVFVPPYDPRPVATPAAQNLVPFHFFPSSPLIGQPNSVPVMHPLGVQGHFKPNLTMTATWYCAHFGTTIPTGHFPISVSFWTDAMGRLGGANPGVMRCSSCGGNYFILTPTGWMTGGTEQEYMALYNEAKRIGALK